MPLYLFRTIDGRSWCPQVCWDVPETRFTRRFSIGVAYLYGLYGWFWVYSPTPNHLSFSAYWEARLPLRLAVAFYDYGREDV